MRFFDTHNGSNQRREAEKAKNQNLILLKRKEEQPPFQMVTFKFNNKLPFISQFGNFIIFPSLRFYVKSTLGILEVQNVPFEHIERL